ncbi:MAG: homocysteine biosynthesis protein [Candidatus Lokiarchaeota archaeon]|nr:homocysteine biosynthesis protein [Candidatus Lokiarchaeota archaeon]
MVEKSFEDINGKIKRGDAVVLTADEMVDYVQEHGVEKAAKDVDVVTTGTFGAMCSSGCFLNFGHSDPPIKMEKLWLNDVEAYHGNAAVDAYLGVTKMSESHPFEYGGGHVIEDLLLGKSIELRAEAYGTDCYPRTHLKTSITLDDLNQAILCNPRNAYQRYSCATNSTKRAIYTYMGKLLPEFENATFSGAGQLSPLQKDHALETIGVGTRIFLGGGKGYVIGEGTQHNPVSLFSTLFVTGDLKQMCADFLKGATFTKYGTTMFVGLGIPIPVLNERIAKNCGLKDSEILTDIVDYGIPRRNRPNLGRVSYEQLKSGMISINGKEVRVRPLSSFAKAKEVAGILKGWIQRGEFLLTKPVDRISTTTKCKPMKPEEGISFVKELFKDALTCQLEDDLESVAKLIVANNEDHVVVVDDHLILQGILTSFDITKAVAYSKRKVSEIVTRKVVSVTPEETIYELIGKLKKYNISAMPVVDNNGKVLGIVSADMLVKDLAPKPKGDVAGGKAAKKEKK